MGRPRKADGERKLKRSVCVSPECVRLVEAKYGTLSVGLEALGKLLLKIPVKGVQSS